MNPVRLIAILEYDGTCYHGWQVQPGLRTVQGTIEEALARMMGERIRVHGSGRTDAGVHALAQVIHFDAVREIPPENVAMGLNTLLPRDVRVTKCMSAPDGFHARFSATGKRYRYRILNRNAPTALFRNTVWHIRGQLDVKAMKRAASCLLGPRDFAAFRSAGDEGTTTRDLRELKISRSGDLLNLFFEADGFLKHMVRNITGALADVGKGKISPEDVKIILRSCSRKGAPGRAPPQGLTLLEVYYNSDGILMDSQKVHQQGEGD